MERQEITNLALRGPANIMKLSNSSGPWVGGSDSGVSTGDRVEKDYFLTSSFWENAQALGFPIQFDLVLKHLRQDMRDDWYFDCLQYDDLFNDPDEAKRTIVAMLQEWNVSADGRWR